MRLSVIGVFVLLKGENMADEVKWICLATDIFDSKKIYAIESLPDGKDIELIWLKLLCLAGRCNEDGFLTINSKMPYTDEMLSTIFRMELGVVKRALDVFQTLEMIEVINNTYMISNWNEYQHTDALAKFRENNRKRVAKHREKMKELEQKNECNVTGNVTEGVTPCNMYNVNVNVPSSPFSNDVKEIIDYLNMVTNKDYKYKTKKTIDCIKARMNEGFVVDDFKKVIDIKAKQWINDPKWNKFLRPETLFGNKFEGYLNEQITVEEEKPYSIIDDWMNA